MYLLNIQYSICLLCIGTVHNISVISLRMPKIRSLSTTFAFFQNHWTSRNWIYLISIITRCPIQAKNAQEQNQHHKFHPYTDFRQQHMTTNPKIEENLCNQNHVFYRCMYSFKYLVGPISFIDRIHKFMHLHELFSQVSIYQRYTYETSLVKLWVS